MMLNNKYLEKELLNKLNFIKLFILKKIKI